MNSPKIHLLAIVLLVWMLPPGPRAAHAQEEDSGARLELVAVHIQPGEVAADTLCKLEVQVTNHGSQPADALGFDVSVAGTQLKIYKTQLFLDPIAAGETKTIQLFNFWSSEDGRGLPAKGALRVEVRLREALWVRLGEAGTGGSSGAVQQQTWESLGAVPGLPVSQEIEVKVKR